MKKITPYLVIGLLAIFLGACNQGAKSSSVAILDIARVAKETGHSDKINQELQQVSEQLKKDLLDIQNKLQAELKTSQEKMGSTPTEQQRQEFGQMITDAQNRLKNAQNQAALTMQQKKNDAVKKLRDDIRSIAADIAKARGMQIVLLKNDNVILTYGEEIDITNEVIAKINKANPVKPAAKTEEKQDRKDEKKDVKKEEGK